MIRRPFGRDASSSTASTIGIFRLIDPRRALVESDGGTVRAGCGSGGRSCSFRRLSRVPAWPVVSTLTRTFRMSLDKATVARVATLARIKVPDADLDKMAGELQGIMTWIEQLAEVNTDGVEPMTSVVGHVLNQRNDVVNDGGYAEAITQNAPERVQLGDGAFFVVNKVIE
jgi:aspartyl-tRNA(Asn)/glutamyl-tRNA(Gln) amidotransferase subunit C